MAVFTSGGISQQNIRDLVSGDVNLTHSNPVVHDAIYCYITALHYLMNNSDKENRA